MENIPLNPIQTAYLIGREYFLPLGGVAMHDFRVYHASISLSKFKSALINLVRKYDALRTYINAVEFCQQIREDVAINLEEMDFSHLSISDALEKLENFQNQVSHYVHPLPCIPWKIWFIQLPQDKQVIFISIDGLILDGYGISYILNDFSTMLNLDSNYVENKTHNYKNINLPFFNNLPADKIYWENETSTYDSWEKFQWKKPLETIPSSRYERSSSSIDEIQLRTITVLAQKHFIMPNTLLHLIVLKALARATKLNSFYVGIPISYSSYCQPKNLRNASTILPLQYSENGENYLLNAKSIQGRILKGMEHISFSGIEIARLLCDQLKTSIPFPVVITNALNWIPPKDGDCFRFHEACTQTPQLLMDIRLSLSTKGSLLIDIDFASEAVPLHVIENIHQAFHQQILELSVKQSME